MGTRRMEVVTEPFFSLDLWEMVYLRTNAQKTLVRIYFVHYPEKAPLVINQNQFYLCAKSNGRKLQTKCGQSVPRLFDYNQGGFRWHERKNYVAVARFTTRERAKCKPARPYQVRLFEPPPPLVRPKL